MIPSLSFFFTHFFLLIRRKRIAEAYLWILLLGVVSISNLARHNSLTRVSYAELFVPDQSQYPKNSAVLVLDDDWSIYRDNTLASPFFNWKLSGDIFLHPEYYENVIQVYDGLKSDRPDIIRDKSNLLRPFLDRMPELNELYERDGIFYIKKRVSN